MNNRKMQEINILLGDFGIIVHKWSPGDGVSRYCFEHNNKRIFTALGYREALTFAKGFAAGCLWS